MRPKQHATTDQAICSGRDSSRSSHEARSGAARRQDRLAVDRRRDRAALQLPGAPGVETRFVIGLLLLKHIYGLSDEGVCERWVHDPYFQHFTGKSSSSMSSRTSARTSATGASGWAIDWSCCWPRACGWRTRAAHCGRRTWRGSR